MVKYDSFESDTQSCAQDNSSFTVEISLVQLLRFSSRQVCRRKLKYRMNCASSRLFFASFKIYFYVKLYDIYLAILNLRRIEHTVRSLLTGY